MRRSAKMLIEIVQNIFKISICFERCQLHILYYLNGLNKTNVGHS